MAGDATEARFACDRTLAQSQLFKLIQRGESLSLDLCSNRKNGHHFFQRCTGPEVQRIFPRPQDAGVAEEVALRADIVTDFRRHSLGVNNGVVYRTLRGKALLALFDMERAGTMTTLTGQCSEIEKQIAESGSVCPERSAAVQYGSPRIIREPGA
jgi:hypothetical protein